jgi:hypothetical protein
MTLIVTVVSWKKVKNDVSEIKAVLTGECPLLAAQYCPAQQIADNKFRFKGDKNWKTKKKGTAEWKAKKTDGDWEASKEVVEKKLNNVKWLLNNKEYSEENKSEFAKKYKQLKSDAENEGADYNAIFKETMALIRAMK